MRSVLSVLKVTMLLLGLMCIQHLVSCKWDRPLVLMVRVEGESMKPTLYPGDQILCVRAPLHQGDIVVADVAQDGLVVKRIDSRNSRQLHLAGDNPAHSATYWVSPEDIKSIMLCRLLLPSFRSVSVEAEGTAYSLPDPSPPR